MSWGLKFCPSLSLDKERWFGVHYLVLRVLDVDVSSVPTEVLEKYPDANKFSYRNTLLNIVIPSSIRGEDGINYTEMKARDRLMIKVEAAKDNDILDLEDTDYEKLKSLASRPLWNSYSKDILTFLEDVMNASTKVIE